MKTAAYRVIQFAAMVVALFPAALSLSSALADAQKALVTDNDSGTYGGHLIVALRSEPKTLNPAVSNDLPSREVISQITADLIHINRLSQQPEPALATSWKISPDGLHYTLNLRRGVHFSDGMPFDADDVVFSFKVYLDEKVNSTQRDSLIVGGQPITVQKIDPYKVTFQLAQPYASAERLFDSVAMLPRHVLEQAYIQGTLAQQWKLGTTPNLVASLGPFRVKEYVPGQSVMLERNPNYWKTDGKGNALPYLTGITFVFVSNEDAEVLRFQSGETDIMNRIGADNYNLLEREKTAHGLQLYDLGPSLEYNFLLFNLNTKLPANNNGIAYKQAWFSNLNFRQAISSAIDRDGMNRIVYHGRGSPIWTHVTPGNRLWFDTAIQRPPRSLSRSRDLLKASGFSWRSDGTLIDGHGTAVEFSIVASASSNQRTQMATMIQQDLQDLGMRIQVVPLEFRGMLDRVLNTHDYEAAIMGLGGADIDPNSQVNVWMSSGDDHLWNLGQSHPATEWEAEIDTIMKRQMSTLSASDRKRLYDRLQEIEAQQVPVVFLISPNLLVAARDRVRNFKPAILDSHTLWNSEQLFVFESQRTAK